MATITIEQAKQQITRACDRLPREVFRELAKRVVGRTPVAKEGRLAGRTRANWRAGVGTPDNTVNEETDRGGSSTAKRAADVVKRAPLGAQLFLTNGLPWIRQLEFGDATHEAHAMVRMTAAEHQPIADAVARNISRTVR